MDGDEKVTPLKTLQGLIWDEDYASGALQSEFYPDVAPALAGWHAAGLLLAVYSSGSEAAQRLLFAHGPAGDLTALLAGFLDTRIGAKRDPDAHAAIARRLDLPPHALLFLSDVEAELDAAVTVGWRTVQLVRAVDGTVASTRHRTAANFATVAQELI